MVGLAADEMDLLNDDHVGRMLARLFDADRASLLTRLVLGAVEAFDIDLSRAAQRLDLDQAIRCARHRRRA